MVDLNLNSGDIHASLMNMLACYIFNQKMGDRCFVYDEAQFLPNLLNQNPQIAILKEYPADTQTLQPSAVRGVISNLKFPEIQKYAGSVFVYRPEFNGAVIDVLTRNGIRSVFDIGVHLTPDASGAFVQQIQLLRNFQQKTKKPTLTVFLAADFPQYVQEFIKHADPSWKLFHVNKNAPKNADEFFIARMAEVQVLAATPALILNYESSLSRFVHLMHRNLRDIEYLKTTTARPWSLV